ncbi:MAG: Ig-like domain-containing protein, partial [Actinomycetota bacterium]|nr:Ig-like domain-containing protein [Actinomycetota bacterium]
HVVPLPLETQIAEFPAAGGPALDCGNPASPHYAPKSSNAVSTSDDKFVNLDSGSLNLSGTAMADISSVSVTLSDSDATTDDVTVDATGLTAGPGEKAWSAEFTRVQLDGLADGTLTAAGTYTLSAGGTTTGATKQIQKDTVVPVATVDLSDTSDSGESNTDNVTNDSTPTISGTVEAGSKVQVFDGATQLGQTTAGANGNYSFTAESLADGVHSVKTMATDPAGNVGTESAALNVTIDTQAALVNASPQGGLFNAAQNVSLNLNNSAQETDTKIYFTLDGSIPQAIESQLYSVPINIAQNRTLKYRALDKAGNMSDAGTQSYRFDTVAPRITSKSPAANATRVGLAANVRTTFSENVTGVNGVTIKLKQGTKTIPAVVTYSAATRTAVLNPSANLASGKKYTVVLTSGIRDGVGNRLTAISWKFTTR